MGLQDAPVLDTSKLPALTPVEQNAGAPSGAVGTLITSLVDFAVPAGQLDNVTDPDLAEGDFSSQLGIALTGTDTTNGTWWYSTNNGASWFTVGAVSASSARLLAADGATRLYFQPTPAFSGFIGAAIAFRAWDRSSGSNGGLASPSPSGGTSA